MSLPNVHLDGTTLEGGGQLLRLGLTLSSLLRLPVHVTRIRGKRGPKSTSGKSGGLKPAHLAGARWLAKATSAETEGLELRSTDLTFQPSRGRADGDDHSDPRFPPWKHVFKEGKVV